MCNGTRYKEWTSILQLQCLDSHCKRLGGSLLVWYWDTMGLGSSHLD